MGTSTNDSLYQSMKVQARIIHALLMREIITRYGRHNIGFAWLFAEPMLFTLGVALLWKSIHQIGNGDNINIFAFTITSYSTVLVWRNAVGRCTLAIEPNAALLAHRNVRPIDFFISRIILEIIGTSISALVMLLLFMGLDLIPPPADILTMLWGWFLVCWYSTALALLIGGLSEFSDLVERLWHPISYFQLPLSGVFAMAAWLPPNVRHFILLFPVPNAVEIFRYGYFGDVVKPYYNTLYVCVICLILTWLGLLVIRSASTRLEAR
jgi:capsular polysaccharide transport system permease protein